MNQPGPGRIRPWRRGTAAVVVGLLLGLCGCDDWRDDHHDVDYVPADQMGAIMIQNHTFTDIHVLLDDVEQTILNDGDDWTMDLQPGVHRVFLLEEDGDRSYRADADILDGRVILLEVYTAVGDLNHYSVDAHYR